MMKLISILLNAVSSKCTQLALKLLQTVLQFKDQVSEARLRTFCLAIVCSRDSSCHWNSAYQVDADPLRYPAAEHTALALCLRGTSRGLLWWGCRYPHDNNSAVRSSVAHGKHRVWQLDSVHDYLWVLFSKAPCLWRQNVLCLFCECHCVWNTEGTNWVKLGNKISTHQAYTKLE